jgi:hypothetical protein
VSNEKELWHRLENEPDRAYEAFQTFLSLPSGDRTLVAAYRAFVGNPDASKLSDAWNGWARHYAWKERARAYDAHIDRIRRTAMEKAIEEEAAEQARQAERTRYHLNELLTNFHAKTMDFLEQMDPADMRFSDAVQVARLHIEHVDKFGSGNEGRREDDWTEEDDAKIERIAKEIKSRRNSEEGAQDPEEQDSESDGSGKDKEDSENPKNNPDYR